MKTILILALSDLENDARVSRQIRFLAPHYRILAAGYSPHSEANVTFIPIQPSGRKSIAEWLAAAFHRLTAAYVADYWRRSWVQDLFNRLGKEKYDLILANDLCTLPLAVRLAEVQGCKLLFDAHEYAPREFDDSWWWRLVHGPRMTALCRTFLPRVDAMTTVCRSIQLAYHQLTGVQAQVVTNAPDYQDLPLRPHVEGSPIHLVHHGVTIPARKLENMIYMMDYLDGRFELHFLLKNTNPDYHARLEKLAQRVGRVHFLPPVPMRSLPAAINRFDMGIFLLEPTNFNYRLALPNKIFEFIQARLGLAVGPSPEMARLVKETGTGIVSADFRPRTLAACLNQLRSEDINRFKHQAQAAARQQSAEGNRALLLQLCADLLTPIFPPTAPRLFQAAPWEPPVAARQKPRSSK